MLSLQLRYRVDLPLLIKLLCCLLFDHRCLHIAISSSAGPHLDCLVGEAQLLPSRFHLMQHRASCKHSEVSAAEVLPSTTQVVFTVSADFKQYII